MLHALYFTKNSSGPWSVSYVNRYVQSETLRLERAQQKPCFLPAIEGDSAAIIAAYIFNFVSKHFATLNYTRSKTLCCSQVLCIWHSEMSEHEQQLRFGKVNKDISNTNVFEHAGRVFAVAENHLPQEICIQNLDTGDTWDLGGEWDRAFTAHPKVWKTVYL